LPPVQSKEVKHFGTCLLWVVDRSWLPGSSQRTFGPLLSSSFPSYSGRRVLEDATANSWWSCQKWAINGKSERSLEQFYFSHILKFRLYALQSTDHPIRLTPQKKKKNQSSTCHETVVFTFDSQVHTAGSRRSVPVLLWSSDTVWKLLQKKWRSKQAH
jgi:hypothetical protein